MQARPIQQGWVSQGELSVCTEVRVRVRARVWDTGQQVERDGPQGEEEGRIERQVRLSDPEFLDVRHRSPVTVVEGPEVILQGLVSRSDRIADAVSAPDPAFHLRIAAAQVAAMVRVDLEGRPVGRRNARLEMNRDNQPATGAKSDTHTAEHLTPWP